MVRIAVLESGTAITWWSRIGIVMRSAAYRIHPLTAHLTATNLVRGLKLGGAPLSWPLKSAHASLVADRGDSYCLRGYTASVCLHSSLNIRMG